MRNIARIRKIWLRIEADSCAYALQRTILSRNFRWLAVGSVAAACPETAFLPTRYVLEALSIWDAEGFDGRQMGICRGMCRIGAAVYDPDHYWCVGSALGASHAGRLEFRRSHRTDHIVVSQPCTDAHEVHGADGPPM